MRYASRESVERPTPNPLHVSIDALLEEARQIEREKVLLEVRREIDRIKVTQPRAGSSWDSEPRRGGDVRDEALAVIDRKLS